MIQSFKKPHGTGAWRGRPSAMSPACALKRLAWVFLAGGVVISSGCATAPPTQEMSDARQALDAARRAEATRHAPDALEGAENLLSQAEEKLGAGAFTQAQRAALAAKEEATKARAMASAISAAKAVLSDAAAIDALSPEAQGLLLRAEIAAKVDDDQNAVRLAGEAAQRAKQDINNAYLAKAKSILDDAKTVQNIAAGQRAVLGSAEAAYRNREGKKSYELSRNLLEELRAAQPMPPKSVPQQIHPLTSSPPKRPVLTSYIVKEGDSLWKISGRAEVYGNPHQWPLIYHANRKKIKNTNVIRPGQVFAVIRK
ncbi:MAG: LysM peptidoglycan-binding domain-containing protein [Gammaproteobacteria bacterium]